MATDDPPILWAAGNSTSLPPWLVLLFFCVWLILFGSIVRFWLRIVPAAIRRWADRNGFQILEKRGIGYYEMMFKCPFRWSILDGNCYSYHFVRGRDRDGSVRDCWIKAGYSNGRLFTVDGCSIEVIWDGAKLTTPAGEPEKLALWDRDLDA